MAGSGSSSFTFCAMCRTGFNNMSSEAIDAHFRACSDRWVRTPEGRAMTQFADQMNQGFEQQRRQRQQQQQRQQGGQQQQKQRGDKVNEKKDDDA